MTVQEQIQGASIMGLGLNLGKLLLIKGGGNAEMICT